MSDRFSLLQANGDPFERIIAQCDELSGVLHPYAEIWSSFILPRRVGDGSMVEEKWIPFASSHYTALIRLHHACNAKNALLKLCENIGSENGYELLLNAHADWSAFWENLGSVVDNLKHVRKEAGKLMSANDSSDEYEVGHENLTLKFAYDRRTQFIHKAIVPAMVVEGMVVFNTAHYDDEQTNWHIEKQNIDSLDSRIHTDWADTLKELHNEWNALKSYLFDLQKSSGVNASTVSGTSFPKFNSDEVILGTLNGMLTLSPPPSGSAPIAENATEVGHD